MKNTSHSASQLIRLLPSHDTCLLNKISSAESSAPICGLWKNLQIVFSESWHAGEVSHFGKAFADSCAMPPSQWAGGAFRALSLLLLCDVTHGGSGLSHAPLRVTTLPANASCNPYSNFGHKSARTPSAG